MADTTYTNYFNLEKPSYTDPADIGVINSNMDIIDSQLFESGRNVQEFSDRQSFPSSGSSNRIYIARDTNLLYRWNGTTYEVVSASPELGETSTTAYRGDRGKIAYDHAQAKGSAFASGLYKITTNSEGHVTAAVAASKGDLELGNVDNTSDMDKPVSTATQNAINTAIQFSTISTSYIDGLFVD